MFSGIVEYLGTVSAVTGMGRGKKLAIQAGHLVQQARPGDSIAVNGACLTVVSVNEQVLEVEAVAAAAVLHAETTRIMMEMA